MLRRTLAVLTLSLALPAVGEAQSRTRSNPYLPQYQAPTLQTYSRAATQYGAPPAVLTANRYMGTQISRYDSRVSPYSPQGALNRYTSDGGRIYAQDGQYLGRLNSNRYDPESVSNPYGQYGSRYSTTSVNNPYSAYGSRYSTLSATNPYTTTPPIVVYPRRY